MKGHEIINHIVRAKMPDTEQIRETCIRQYAPWEQREKRPFLRSAALMATAALVVVCCLFGNMVLSPQSNNAFSVKAYAHETQADGSIGLRDYEIGSQGASSVIVSIGDGYFYTSIYLETTGANIKNVEFFADGDGVFAKAYFLMENGEFVYKNYSEEYDDDGNYIGGGGGLTRLSLEKLGSSFTLDDVGGLPDDSVLMIGKPDPSGEGLNRLNITIRAVATFHDGTTQEETLLV